MYTLKPVSCFAALLIALFCAVRLPVQAQDPKLIFARGIGNVEYDYGLGIAFGPGGSTVEQRSTTNGKGIASFSVTDGAGTYVLALHDIARPGGSLRGLLCVLLSCFGHGASCHP